MTAPLPTTAHGSRPGALGPGEWALLLGTAAIWGSSYLWIELALESLGPGVVTVARIALGVTAVALVPGARQPVDRADRWRVVVLGAGWFALPMIAFPIAQDLGVATSVVGLLNGAVPIMTTAAAAVMLRALPPRQALLGLGVGLVGLAVVAWPEGAAAGTGSGGRAVAVGIALILGSMAIGSVLVHLLVPLQQRYGALPVLLRAQVVALIVALPFGAADLPGSRASTGALLALLPLGLLSTGLAFTTWTTLIGRAGASRAAVVSYLVPVVAVLLGVVLLGERLAPIRLLGAVAVIGGAWLVAGAPSREE